MGADTSVERKPRYVIRDGRIVHLPGMLRPGGALRPVAVHDSRSALRSSRRGMFAALGVLTAGQVAVTVAMPPLGAVLLGSTGAAVFLGRRAEQLAAVEHQRELSRSTDEQADVGYIDALTGLPNRQQLIDQIGREVARAERYAQEITLGVIEIERFHELEKVWGTATTEKAVQHVAATLGRVVRQADFLSRLDERRFAVVLVGCTREQSAAFGDRVMLAVGNRPFQASDRGRLPLYVSVDMQALQYEPEKYRGPLDFLSAAGGDVVTAPAQPTPAPRSIPAAVTARTPGEPELVAAPGTKRAADPRALRRQLVRDYYPEGKAEDFASAYGRFRRKNAS